MPRIARSRRNTDLHESLSAGDLLLYGYAQEGYAQHIQRLFPFMRANANGAYSDITIMRCVRAAEDFQNLRHLNDQQRLEKLPWIGVFVMPYSYDELTEIKNGGTVGMVAAWPDKAIIAVHESCRRKNVGTALYNHIVSATGNYPVMWAGRQNIAGQHFLLSQGLTPSAMNAQGAIRYSRGETQDD